ncbi:MAG: carboxypeptidase-like regulatory domain-containing protein [Thermonemataceae bacterium]|nr:carboxypeptidase-like regulatory domain-containing protein [Thermonemataceae bacterium]
MQTYAVSFLCLLFASTGFAQMKKVEGFIFEASTNKPIEYAEITILNRMGGVYSDAKGYFSLQQNFNPRDTLVISALGYIQQKIILQEIELPLKIYLKEEIIEEISVRGKRTKIVKYKVGDLRNTNGSFLSNKIRYFNRSKITFINYIPNIKNKKGFIESIYIKLHKKNNLFLKDVATGAKIYYKSPNRIKIRIRCLSANKDLEPEKDLSKQEMIFEITSFKNQWIDISKYNIPFPENGAFVGMEILEVIGEDGMGNVSMPYFEVRESDKPAYIFGGGKWSLQKKRATFLGAEVSLEK